VRPARPRLGERKPGESSRPHEGRAAEQSGSREPGGRPRGARGGSESRATSSGRILIVDDEQAIRLVCRLNLQEAGFDTLEAEDGTSALALARAELPDLILLDIMLPEVDGWRVAEELRAKPETRGIPILFLSARSERSDEARAYELGGVGYITKPFDPISMTEKVRSIVERARRGEHDALRREWREPLGPR